MNAEIITIGDEILIGQIVDTNSAWMAKELNAIGINVSKITSISDQKEDIVSSLEQAIKRVSLVLITGGLGPTNDDLTKKTLSDYFNMELVQDPQLYSKIKDRLAKLNIPMNRFNVEQALVPNKAKIIPNNFGSAPCMWFQENGKHTIAMPGVPSEMKGIMKSELLSQLQEQFQSTFIEHQTIMTQGIGESVLADLLANWEDNLPNAIKLAYLPKPGQVRLRLSAKGDNKEQLQSQLNQQVKLLQQIIPNNIFALNDTPIEHNVAQLLKHKKQNLATAESCTGGYISHLITSQSGSSLYFKGSIVAYSNEIKQQVLKVKTADLEQYGAVSQQVVEQMAQGAKQLMNTDYAIATSGIAGPDGGTKEKPVGTVWIALATPTKVISEKLQLSKSRERNIKLSALKVLHLLLNELRQ